MVFTMDQTIRSGGGHCGEKRARQLIGVFRDQLDHMPAAVDNVDPDEKAVMTPGSRPRRAPVRSLHATGICLSGNRKRLKHNPQMRLPFLNLDRKREAERIN